MEARKLDGCLLNYHLPDLEDVIILDCGHDEILLLVPRNVVDLGSVTAVHEQQLSWAVLSVFRSNLRSTATHIPNDCSSISGSTREHTHVERRPLHSHNLLEEIVVIISPASLSYLT